MFDNLEDSLIEQQDLYGAPPVKLNENPIGGGMQVLYGVPSPVISNPGQSIIETPALYGVPPTKKNNTPIKAVAGGTGILLSMVVFIVGLVAMFNKKIPIFAKVLLGICAFIVIVALVALTVGIINSL